MIVLRDRGIPFDPSAPVEVLESQRFMTQPATGRQRDWALALGLPFSNNTTHAEMAALLDEVATPPYDIYDGEPTADQRKLAAEWELAIPVSADRAEAARVFFRFLVARAWVYSVCRHILEAEWQLHSESALPVALVNSAARGVLQNADVFAVIWNKKAMSHSTTDVWDAWFRVTEQTTHTEEYRYSMAVARQYLGQYLRTGTHGQE